jgi:hypothetical protein
VHVLELSLLLMALMWAYMYVLMERYYPVFSTATARKEGNVTSV